MATSGKKPGGKIIKFTWISAIAFTLVSAWTWVSDPMMILKLWPTLAAIFLIWLGWTLTKRRKAALKKWQSTQARGYE